jgi:error-prone DNA polymerase
VNGFVELHARSAFSFLEGSSTPEELVEQAAVLGMPALALLDRDGVYGAPRFHMAAKKAGIRAHVGAEITSEQDGRIPLLVENRAGYRNLCRLVTRMKLRAKKGEGSAAEEELVEHAAGLICLTGGADGPLATALTAGFDTAIECAERLVHRYGRGNVYAEVQRHFARDEEARNQAVVEIARRCGLPLIATNGVRHAKPAGRRLLDVLTCIRHKVRLSTAGRLLVRNAESYLKDEKVMRALFADMPGVIDRTAELSARLEYSLADLGYEFPRYPVPERETQISFLRKRVDEGARRRYRPYHEKARKQIERELALIEKLDLPGYFLIVWDIVEFCRREGILAQGRGSAANSAVCYSLGITAVDPVGMDLLFERFLSEERGEWPDIDLDLPSGDQRERAIQYVYERYGKRGAAMTANVITYRGRSAAREVGEVLEIDETTLGRLAGMVHAWEWHDPKDTVEKQFRDAGLDPKDTRIRDFFRLFVEIQDLPRHLGQHSGGMVICQGELDSVVPLEPASMPGRVVVQWDKDDCANMGILKVDLLGLGMLAAVEECLIRIRESYGEEVDLAHLPQNDPAVYDALQKADTIGMFQVESRAQMSCLPRLRPANFYDIVVEVAIIRPGPIVGKMVHPYLRRRQGKEPAECLHPWLEPVLRRTLGVPLFQEQLLRMAMICAGFTGGEAEELRRAFGFKRAEAKMSDVEVKLRRGMEKNGIVGKTQDAIVQSITSFALYGFPESHAASFALIAYASAYLKCHYPAAFTAALLNNQPMGFYHPATIVKDAQRHGLHFRPIDVTRSMWECTIEESANGEKSVRLGFGYVRGLRREATGALINERSRRPFAGIEDLTTRVPELRKPELAMLAEIGALNFLQCPAPGPQLPVPAVHRRDALWQVERIGRPTGPLYRNLPDSDAGSPLKAMTEEERLAADFHGTGMTIGRHAISLRRKELTKMGVLRAKDLRSVQDGSTVRVAGIVIVRQRPGTAKGFVFLSLEDETGISNVIVEPDRFDTYRVELVNEPFLIVEGKMQNQDRVLSVKAQRIEALPLASAVPSHDFH